VYKSTEISCEHYNLSQLTPMSTVSFEMAMGPLLVKIVPARSEEFLPCSQTQAACPTVRQMIAFHHLHSISLSLFEYYLPIYVYIFTVASFLRGFFHQNPLCTSSLPHACDRFDSLRSVQTVRFLIKQLFRAWVSSPRPAARGHVGKLCI